ncbi:cadherin domain-containing protein [Sphaerotilus sp.]|uniref:cadherin domain-containing protein n=1 Tax=Sphaerotilus sp. TaxID=2093942 RepID=UPI0025E39C0B|nr:cadherin domain-containing protein [Sphaerotilus sp.]
MREDAAVGTAVGYQAQATDADATNSTVAYTLTDDAGGRFAIDASTGTVTVARALDAETAVAHTVTAQARSADGSVSSQSFTITVQDADEFDATVPTDNDAAVNTVQNIDAVGTAVGITAWSRDADLTLNQITYTLLDDAGGRFAIDASTGVVTLARSITTDTNTLQTLLVQAASADSSVATVRFSVAITPVNLFAPVIGSDGGGATAALTVQENTTAVTTVTATDADVAPGPLTYTLVGGADQALFTLDASTGVLRFVAAPDAERPRDAGADNGYEVTVQTSDGVRFDTQALTLTVADVNEFAIGALHDTDTTTNTVQENAAIGTTVGVQMRADDADATQSTVTYRLDTSSGGLFAINASTGVLTVAGLLDAETALVHTVTVRATSADGSTTTLTVSIAVQDVNEYGITPVTDNDPQANRVREDDPVGTVVGITASAQDRDATNHVVSYALTDDAGGRFSIEASSGVITIARALDAEFAQVHSLTVRALSSDGSAQFLTTTVAVQDVNEVPVGPISDTDAAPDSVAENAAIGTRIGFTAQASDGDVTNNTVTYALLDNAGGRFAIDANTGVITVAAALDAEAAQQHTLRVQATSSDHSQSIQSLTVAVTDVDEFDLVRMDDTDAAPNTVAENAVVGTAVGVRAESVDGDVTRNLVTYRLDNDAGGRFAIDANTGVVTVAGGLNAEASLQHTLTVRATSADGSAWTQDFTVDVTDVNEFGVARLADADAQPDAVLENAAVGTAVGVQGSAKDDDATTSTVTYTLDDSAGGRFAVDASTGAVTLARSVQEEGVASRGIVLRATSADGSSMAMAFTIAITAVNDATPVITSDGGGATAALSVQEGQTAVTQVQAQDADLPAETLRYTLAGGADAAWFTLDPVSGALRFTAAPDAETPLDQGADNVYDLTVQVSDGLHTAAQTLRITVQPLNDTAPVITSDGGGATALRHVAENTLDITQVQARDADLPADTLTYTVAGGADAALFTVDARTGALRWVAAPDRETPRDVGADGTYDVTVSASDGLHSVSQALTIVVDNVDEAPRLDTNALAILEGGTARPVLVASDVDTPAARLVYTVQTLSGGRFEQVAVPGVAVTRFTQAEADAGAIRFVADGGEAAPVYTLALADDTTTLAAQAAVVAFTPVNDVPVVAAVDLGTVAEDTARVITAAELLAGATDAEGDTLTVSTLRLAAGEGTLTDLGGGRWRFDPAADWHGAVALAGMVSDGQAGTALAASLQVRAVNDAPRIVSGGGAATLALDQAENTATVTTVVGTDVDADVRLHYAVVGGADAARFQIDAATGALSFRQAPDREQPTDANGDNRYDVTVEVSDGVLTAQQALQITVTNVDEAPVVRRNVLLLSDGTVTLVLQASDPDTPATALTYRVDAVAGGQFERVVAPGTVVQVFTQAELDAAQVVWVAPVGSTAASYALRLSDGVSEVQIGSPALERQSATAAATATELTLVGLAAGDAAVVPSAGAASSAATLAAAIDSTRRAAAREMPALAADDASLGLGKTAQPEQAAVSRGSRVVDVAAAVTRMVAARGGSALTTATAMAVAVQGGELALDLPSEGAEAPKQLGTNLNSLSVRTGTALAEQLDRLRQEVGEAHQAGMVSLASTALISTGVSVGYVIWLVRGGVLMTSLMSVVPAWAGMDPLPVLAEMRRTGGGGAGTDGADDGGEDDPIEKLFSKARRLLVRPVAGLASAPAPAPDLPETPA